MVNGHHRNPLINLHLQLVLLLQESLSELGIVRLHLLHLRLQFRDAGVASSLRSWPQGGSESLVYGSTRVTLQFHHLRDEY